MTESRTNQKRHEEKTEEREVETKESNHLILLNESRKIK